MRDFAKKRCLTKALLESLMPDIVSGLDLYLCYFEKTQLVDPMHDVNVSALARFSNSRRIIKRMQYRAADPMHEPPHLSFFSSESLNRLAELNNLEIVIYYYDFKRNGGASLPPSKLINEAFWKDKKLDVYHDFRAYSNSLIPRPKIVFYILTSRKQLFRLNDESLGLDSCLAKSPPFFANRHAYFSSIDQGFESFLTLSDHLLARHFNLDARDLGPAGMFHAREFMTSDRHQLADRWSPLVGQHTSILVVTFVRSYTLLVTNRNKMIHPERTRFMTLCAVPAADNKTQSNRWRDCPESVQPNSPVICIFADRFAVVLSEPYRARVVNSHIRAVGLKERLHNRRAAMPNVSKNLPDSVVRAAKLKRDAKKRKRAGDCMVKKCKCSTCCKNLDYENNMSKSGPERLCTTPYTIREILQFLGCLDESAESILDELCRLSVASMDIESRTVQVDLKDPRPGPLVDYREVSKPVLEGHVKKVQKPLMIAHCDGLTCDNQGDARWSATASDDSERAIFAMFEKYWSFVKGSKDAVIQRKLALARPLLDIVQKYKEAYLEFGQNFIATSYAELQEALLTKETEIRRDHEQEDDVLDPDDVDQLVIDAKEKMINSDEWQVPKLNELNKTFNHLLPGMLELQLKQLITRYVVFTFYG